MKLSARLAREKYPKRIDAPEIFSGKGGARRKDLESLFAKLGFPHTFLFGEFARFQLRARYLMIRQKWYNPTISERENMTFRWWISALHSVSPAVAPSPPIGRISSSTPIRPPVLSF